ncbi:uncharacterized protein LOC132733454 isoform X1 [Ruditapes philippinarum]|uniref:uncharacterized protein LOC132733454 isoform X1 n=1 Tax=Ruditapes philippinarum TaxID=129788 RepID=UPI00295BBF25|nr:uncharacterized protein LOC132733454 isoform X1 [Ruditapes philippinarum]
MFQSTDSRAHFSLMLSEVLDDIGVNERNMKKGRRVFLLIETMQTMTRKSFGFNNILYILGSRSEGTTTIGLESDSDILFCSNDANVIQDRSEWEEGKVNYFMIQDENTTPGYCFLQLFQNDKPLPGTIIPDGYHMTDRRGRILLKNTINTMLDMRVNETREGPSICTQGPHGFNDLDYVLAYPCKSWPKSASGWLERHRISRWPTQDMRRDAASTCCFVVPTGSKVSANPELEWRISTSLAERCLMFDLNMTQIKCYVFIKMVLKSFLNPQREINISSFMCKTILFHCIEHKEASIWKENNLLDCLKDCLIRLHNCVEKEYLPHFIIPENNLMAGQFTAETKHKLLKNISDFIQNDVQSILKIDIDDLGLRLRYKLNLVYNLNSSLVDCRSYFSNHYFSISMEISNNHYSQLQLLHNKDIRIMKHYVETLMTYKKNDNTLEQAACKFQAPLICTTYGSALASASIGLKHPVSPQALVWLLDGFDSDTSSGRLKLASVFYSEGDMEKTEIILRQTESQFHSFPVSPFCGCRYTMPRPPEATAEFGRFCNKQNEDFVKDIIAFCVRFLKQEINCVPHELQYEMFRSTPDDIKHNNQAKDFWMDLAVVDSLPFLYFLQYKVYRHLHRYKDKKKLLINLQTP